MPYYGQTQTQLFPGRVLHIAGTRVLTAANAAALPSTGRVIQGGEPSGYVDHGSIVAGRVDINVDMPKEEIQLGRIPSAARFYLGSQRGQVRFQMQEYQPEMVDIAGGSGLGVPLTGSGFKQVYIGGQLPPIRRLLLLDDFDVDQAVDATEVWKQYWWTNPNVQGGGTFTRAENGLAWVIPTEYELLKFEIGSINRMLEFRAIS